MSHRASLTAFSLAVLLGLTSKTSAQQTRTPALDEILDRLEENLNHYDARVPSLFCDEHVVSSQVQSGQRDQNTITDAIFRLVHTSAPNHTSRFEESREVKRIDGRPATTRPNNAPTLLNGAFEGGLAVVSRSQTSCVNYSLQHIDRHRLGQPYVIRFATVLTPRNSADCLLQENSKGFAVVDPTSLQISHLELTTAHHVIVPGGGYRDSVVGKRVIQIDYAPIVLGDENFWLPSTIVMRNTSGAGSFHMIEWSYRANYGNYHNLEVRSRILPGGETSAQ